MRRVFILGTVGYQNDNSIVPVYQRLKEIGAEVHWCRAAADPNAVWSLEVLNPSYITVLVEALQASVDAAPSTILFPEFWNPSIEIARLFLNKAKADVRLVAMYRGSSHIPGDIFASEPKVRYCEESWIHCLDALLVPTHYARNVLRRYDNVIVTGWPSEKMLQLEFRQRPKTMDHRVAFTSRLDSDKNYSSFMTFVKEAQGHGDFLIASPVPLEAGSPIVAEFRDLGVEVRHFANRKDLFEELYKCTHLYSDPLQETFGYSVLEAVALGTTPILAKHPVYLEHGLKRFCHKTMEGRVRSLIHGDPITEAETRGVLDKMKTSTKNIAETLL